MLEYKGGNQTALIVLHEIYGINDFITKCCRQYHDEGYDVFCPDLLCGKAVFPYEKSEEAYHVFRHMAGFDAYEDINALAVQLRQSYQKVFIIGFSVGATLAWRCSESALYDGAICCCGSRIRDYLSVAPHCPTLLVFAGEDSFDVAATGAQLYHKQDTTIEIVEGKHGFADCYGENYNPAAFTLFDLLRKSFLAAWGA